MSSNGAARVFIMMSFSPEYRFSMVFTESLSRSVKIASGLDVTTRSMSPAATRSEAIAVSVIGENSMPSR